jgi:hypothetical protein
LADIFDFVVHYTDWSHTTPADALPVVRTLTPSKPIAAQLGCFVSAAVARLPNPEGAAVVVAFDGTVVVGRNAPCLPALWAFLRLMAFHILRPSFVPAGDRASSAESPWAAALDVRRLAQNVAQAVAGAWRGQSRDSLTGGWEALRAKAGAGSKWTAASCPLLGEACALAAATLDAPEPAPPQGVVESAPPQAALAAPSQRAPSLLSPAWFKLPRPSALAAPALPAAADAARSIKAPLTLEADWPVLAVPLVSGAYLASLEAAAVALGAGAAGGRGCGGREASVVVAAAAPVAAVPAVDSVAAAAAAAAAADSEAAAAAMDSVAAQWLPWPPAAGAAPSPPDAAPASPQRRLWLPALFTARGQGAAPSHRVLWLQQGLVTTLVFAPAASFADAARPVSPASASPIVSALQAASAGFLPHLSAPLAEWFAEHAAAAAASPLDAAPTILASRNDSSMAVHGLPHASRRALPAAAMNTISQASPAASTLVGEHLPHHLVVALARAADSISTADVCAAGRLKITAPMHALVNGANGGGRAAELRAADATEREEHLILTRFAGGAIAKAHAHGAHVGMHVITINSKNAIDGHQGEHVASAVRRARASEAIKDGRK